MLNLIRLLGHEIVYGLELEVPDFNCCGDTELVDQYLDEFLAIITIPIVAELFILLVLFQSCYFGMFLDESREDLSSPLLGVEVEELWCAFGLGLVDVVVELRVL